MPSKSVAASYLQIMRSRGRVETLSTLRSLVGRGLVTLTEAERVWRDAFGGRLVAVSARASL